MSLRQYSVDTVPHIPASFPILCETLENTIESMKSLRLSEPNRHNRNLGLTVICQFNGTIYDHLPETLMARADGLFSILFIKDTSPQSLLSVSKTMAQELPGYQNTCRIAAIKYMSSLYSQNSGDFDSSLKIEHF